MPIGNLTSQILSNLFMNEFDSYVRHVVKPLAYVRYGDDFVLFCRTKQEVRDAKRISLRKLRQLGLTVNATQNQIMRSWQGLHFLGHIITKDGSAISKRTRGLMLRRLNLRNIASYSSLKLHEDMKRELPWRVEL